MSLASPASPHVRNITLTQRSPRPGWDGVERRLQERDAEPVGGVARFITLVRSFDALKPMILFSGDLLSPSNCAFCGVPQNGAGAPV